MLTILEMPQDNTVGLRIEGKITEEDITRTTTILEEKLRHHTPLKLYVEYEEIDNFSLDLLFQDAAFKARYQDYFRKGAIVSDKEWLAQIVQISDNFTDLDMKTFDFAEKEAALQWLAT